MRLLGLLRDCRWVLLVVVIRGVGLVLLGRTLRGLADGRDGMRGSLELCGLRNRCGKRVVRSGTLGR